jgi:hypothetical protein
MNKREPGQSFGWQQYISDKLKARVLNIDSFKQLVVRVKGINAEPTRLKIALLTQNGAAFSTDILLTGDFQNLKIPFNSLKKDSALLLPRPYPGFQPLMFLSASNEKFNLRDVERLQILFADDQTSSGSFELESVWLEGTE